jgi:hypothetical protein
VDADHGRGPLDLHGSALEADNEPQGVGGEVMQLVRFDAPTKTLVGLRLSRIGFHPTTT